MLLISMEIFSMRCISAVNILTMANILKICDIIVLYIAV